MVVVAVLLGGSLPSFRRLARTLAAPVRCPARPDDDGRDRIGEDTHTHTFDEYGMVW